MTRVCRGRYSPLPVLLGAAALISSCDHSTATGVNYTSISLFPSANIAPLSGVVEITVRVSQYTGEPVHDGTPVTFTCCAGETAGSAGAPTLNDPRIGAQTTETTALGTIQPAETTTLNGMATVRFVAGTRSGTALIIALSGDAKSNVLQLLIGAAAAKRLVLTANPPSVPASGGSVDVTATVLDGTGNGLVGVPVSFSTGSGALSQATAATGANGTAVTRLTTTRETVVTASIGTAVSDVSITVKVIPAPVVSVSLSPQSPTVGQAVQFSYALTIAPGGAALRDLVIDFGDASQRTVTGLAGTTLVSHTYATVGVYTTTSTVTDVGGEKAVATMAIAVQPRPPIIVTLELPTGTVVKATALVFTASVSPSTELSRVASYEWDFGDGTISAVNSATIGHIYLNAGPRIITVTVVTTDGQRYSAQGALYIRES